MPTIKGTYGDTTGALVTNITTPEQLTAMILPATQSVDGTLLASDKAFIDSLSVAVPTPSALVQSRPGPNLSNADVTIDPASDKASLYTLPASTLTNNRVLTLEVTGSPVADSVVQIIRRDLTSHTYTVKDDAGTTLYTFASSPANAQGSSFYFDGTHFKFLSFYYVD